MPLLHQNICLPLIVCLFALAGCQPATIPPHPCENCSPCEECRVGPFGEVGCFPVAVTTRCFSNTVVEVNSCGEIEGPAEDCGTNGFCSELSPTQAVCRCTGNWQGDLCDTCPDHFDPAADCMACLNQWQGSACDVCPGNWDPSQECGECLPGFGDMDDDCGSCEPGYVGDFCDECVVYADADAPAGGDGLSWGTAFASIHDAVDESVQRARRVTDPESGEVTGRCNVWLKQGTYYLGGRGTLHLEEQVWLWGSFAGTERAPEERVFTTPGTILNGWTSPIDFSGPDHIVEVSKVSMLDGLEIRNGDARQATDPSNDGVFGGAVIARDAEVGIRRCVISDNRARKGAGVFMAGGVLWVSDSLFDRNMADTSGGGIYAFETEVTITGSEFRGNQSADVGGAMTTWYAPVSVDNSLFHTNRATGMGAALDNQYGDLAVANSVFYDNTDEVAFTSQGRLSIVNSIVWDVAPVEIRGGALVDVEYSVVTGGFAGVGNQDVDPMFVSPDTGDFHLQDISPCIDAGDGNGAPEVDRDGNGRVDLPLVPNVGGGLPNYTDIGAYEFQP